jgi:hypothetical protein
MAHIQFTLRDAVLPSQHLHVAGAGCHSVAIFRTRGHEYIGDNRIARLNDTLDVGNFHVLLPWRESVFSILLCFQTVAPVAVDYAALNELAEPIRGVQPGNATTKERLVMSQPTQEVDENKLEELQSTLMGDIAGSLGLILDGGPYLGKCVRIVFCRANSRGVGSHARLPGLGLRWTETPRSRASREIDAVESNEFAQQRLVIDSGP